MANDLGTRADRQPTLDDFVYGMSNGGLFEGKILIRDLLGLKLGDFNNIWIDSGAMVPRNSNGALAGTIETTNNKVMNDFYDFAPLVDRFVQFKMPMPDNWDLGPFKIKLYWIASLVPGFGDVSWGISANAIGDGQNVDAAIGTPIQIVDSFLGASNMHVAPASLPVTVGNLPQLQYMTYFQVQRTGSAIEDTYTESARLIGASIQYKERLTAPVIW